MRTPIVAAALLALAGCPSSVFQPLPEAQPPHPATAFLEENVRVVTLPASVSIHFAVAPAPQPTNHVTLEWYPPEDLNGVVMTNGLVDYLVMWGTNSHTYSWSTNFLFPASGGVLTGMPAAVVYITMQARYSNGYSSSPSPEIFTPVSSPALQPPPTPILAGYGFVCVQSSPDMKTWTNYTPMVPAQPVQFFRVQWGNQ